jgi:hypothetical protein
LKNSWMRRAGVVVAAAAVGVVVNAGIASAAPAAADDVSVMAHPTGCSYQIPSGSWGGVAQCTSHNGGSYAATVTCRHSNGKLSEVDGPWRQFGWSRAYCPGDSHAISAGIWTSASNRS